MRLIQSRLAIAQGSDPGAGFTSGRAVPGYEGAHLLHTDRDTCAGLGGLVKTRVKRALVTVALPIALSAMAMAASPVAAGTSEVRELVKPLERAGYECSVKEEMSGYREANCVRGDASVSVVAFKNKATLRSWEPFYCSLGLPGYVTNNRSWILSSSTVTLQAMMRFVKKGAISRC